jgi:site-specific DNA-methyltransferase (adenine-specific)
MTILKLPVDAILVSAERQRKDPSEKHIKELAKSIATDGLIHAVTITKEGELVAGFCRLSAIRTLIEPYRYGTDQIPAGQIPVIIVDGLDSVQLFRIELEENLRRKNLSPVEEAQAIAKLHSYLASNAPSGTWTKTDTGRILDEVRGDSDARTDPPRAKEVGDAILLDSFAQDPDVKKAATKAEAVKIAKKKLEAQFMEGLGALCTVSSKDFTLIEGSADEQMKFLGVGRFSGIIVDPPYGIDADTFGDQTFKLDHQYADDQESALDLITNILVTGYDLCKADAHLYMFCDIRVWPKLCDLASECGWYCYPTPLIWHKPNLGHAPQPGYFLRRYEAILFAQKGSRKLRNSSSDVLEFPATTDKSHAAQKPVELYKKLMDLSFLPGEEVLDPCAGSGTVFRAAKLAGLRATGIELSPTYAAAIRVMLSEGMQ